jgi:hypothetical protein
MMLPLPPNPDSELPLALRAAVEAIRREPVPAEAVRRTTQTLRQRLAPHRPAGRSPRWLLVAGAVAASFFLGVVMHQMVPPPTLAPPAETPSSRTRGDLVVAIPPAPLTQPVSIREVGSRWADWERIRLPAESADFFSQVHLEVQVAIDAGKAHTTVELHFHPSDEPRQLEYGLPPGAVVRGVEAVPGANLLRGTIPPRTRQVRFAYSQSLVEQPDGRKCYSFPLPEQRLEGFRFQLETDRLTDRGAIFLPQEARRRVLGDRVQYEVRHGPVRPSGAISYLPWINPPK